MSIQRLLASLPLLLLLALACSAHNDDIEGDSLAQGLTTMLGGDNHVYTGNDTLDPVGTAEAWRYTFSAGTITSLHFCVRPGNTSTKVTLGLYASNGAGTSPTTLLTQATITGPVTGFNVVQVTPTTIPAGTYWLAAISPKGGGNTPAKFCFRQGSQYGSRWTNTTFAALPTTFPFSGTNGPGSQAGFYAAADGVGSGAGGAPGTGGTSAGGAPAAGGRASGGALGAGGAASGGAAGTGGSPAAGGAVGSGGNAGAGAPRTGMHVLGKQSISVGNQVVTTAGIDTQSSGSSMIVSAGRGTGSLLVSSTISDNKGNTPYVQQAKLNYTDYPDSSAALYALLDAKGGAGHTFSLANLFADEGTIVAVEVKHGLVIKDVKAVKMSAGNLTSPSVTTTGPATIVAFCWPGGGFGFSSVSVNNSFTVLDKYGAQDGLSVQAASASRDVSAAGTYNLTWTVSPAQEAILFIIALQ